VSSAGGDTDAAETATGTTSARATPRVSAPGRSPGDVLRRWAAGAALAVGLLTVLPVPSADSGEGELGRAVVWLPLVGALVGALAGGVRVLAQPLLGALPATAVALALFVASTGALHQDGLADTADGIGARGDAQRRLAAMRDPAIGAFGVLALLWWGLVLLTTLGSLTDLHALRALIVAGAVSRWTALLHAASSPAARADGLGAAFQVDSVRLVIASGLAIAVAVAAGGPLAGLVALGAGLLTAALSVAWVRKSLGGRTGDTLGATIAVTEAVVCVALLAVWHG
jgi:adenosylcobinamide-GDP ribazoletransferase